MMLKHHRIAMAAAGVLGGALLITGCGAASALPSAPDAGNAGTALTGDIGTSNCSEADFIASASPVEGWPGSFLVTYGNRSDKVCTINGGVPNLHGVDMTNSPIEQLPVEDVRIPDVPKEFTLKPGDVVYAGIFVVPGDKGDPNSYVLTGFQSSLPDMSEEQNVNIVGDGPVEITGKQLQVTSLATNPDDLMK
ncbi:DUF4232 domain-containing protein [Saccharopolyspora sp. WRP15-2]|uniref:DUF4232 domain-containing protein n=1 Tax=Saccharopolyspora oryzae TaxID=2997343 RepID=A0ABT4UUE0_9PSEU|nr:DUF4232 domain-containing protein [Saccharopolyspora oryzae]MDA3625173.1 DUF4232 domain-containing protein [Saccharopolyspora oryzae]